MLTARWVVKCEDSAKRAGAHDPERCQRHKYCKRLRNGAKFIAADVNHAVDHALAAVKVGPGEDTRQVVAEHRILSAKEMGPAGLEPATSGL